MKVCLCTGGTGTNGYNGFMREGKRCSIEFELFYFFNDKYFFSILVLKHEPILNFFQLFTKNIKETVTGFTYLLSCW